MHLFLNTFLHYELEIMLDVAIIAEAAYFESLKFSLLMINVVAIDVFCEQVGSIVMNLDLVRVHFEIFYTR